MSWKWLSNTTGKTEQPVSDLHSGPQMAKKIRMPSSRGAFGENAVRIVAAIRSEWSQRTNGIHQNKLRSKMKGNLRIKRTVWLLLAGLCLSTTAANLSRVSEMGANRKILNFIESRHIQEYLKNFLDANGYAGQLMSFNGTNSDREPKRIIDRWIETNTPLGRASRANPPTIAHFFRSASSLVRSSSWSGFQSIATAGSDARSTSMSAVEMSIRRSSNFFSRGTSLSR